MKEISLQKNMCKRGRGKEWMREREREREIILLKKVKKGHKNQIQQ